MKTIAVNQPYLYPYLGYFQLIKSVDTFVIYDDVNFIKKGWIHRNNILTPQGPLLFTVPLKDASQNRLIKDTLIHESFAQWRSKFVNTLAHCYQNSSNYEEAYLPVAGPLYDWKVGFRGGLILPNKPISQLCLDTLKKILKYLNIKTKIVNTSTIYQNSHLKGQDRIIDICKQEKADQYINLIGGQHLYNKKLFEKEHIELKFHQIKPHTYKQFLSPFIPNLSIIDVLMSCKPCEIQDLLQQYELI